MSHVMKCSSAPLFCLVSRRRWTCLKALLCMFTNVDGGWLSGSGLGGWVGFAGRSRGGFLGWVAGGGERVDGDRDVYQVGWNGLGF